MRHEEKSHSANVTVAFTKIMGKNPSKKRRKHKQRLEQTEGGGASDTSEESSQHSGQSPNNQETQPWVDTLLRMAEEEAGRKGKEQGRED